MSTVRRNCPHVESGAPIYKAWKVSARNRLVCCRECYRSKLAESMSPENKARCDAAMSARFDYSDPSCIRIIHP